MIADSILRNRKVKSLQSSLRSVGNHTLIRETAVKNNRKLTDVTGNQSEHSWIAVRLQLAYTVSSISPRLSCPVCQLSQIYSIYVCTNGCRFNPDLPHPVKLPHQSLLKFVGSCTVGLWHHHFAWDLVPLILSK